MTSFIHLSPLRSSHLLFLVCLFLSWLVYAPGRARGAGVQTSRAAGVVESIDLGSKTLVLKTDSGTELKLSWYWDTTFLADGKRAKPDALKPGTKVEVRYHSPLFGREYAAKIEWHSAMTGRMPLPRPGNDDFSDPDQSFSGAQRQRLSTRFDFPACA